MFKDTDNQRAAFRQQVQANTHALENLALVLDLFRFQALHNAVYASYLDHIGCVAEQVTDVVNIPYLPIEFFRTHAIKTGSWDSQVRFLSSGTTQSVRSVHELDASIFYQTHAMRIFEECYGSLSGISLLGLFPSYHADSSLLHMIDGFCKQAAVSSGLVAMDSLDQVLMSWSAVEEKKVLFGGALALCEVRLPRGLDLTDIIIIETGGLKGQQTPLIDRAVLHSKIQERFGVPQVHSEYGMTEMLSQAYGVGGYFRQSYALFVRVRDLSDPFAEVPVGEIGGLDVMDLANVHSCCFLQTQDLGRKHPDGTFEVLGRVEGAVARGCHMLYE